MAHPTNEKGDVNLKGGGKEEVDACIKMRLCGKVT